MANQDSFRGAQHAQVGGSFGTLGIESRIASAGELQPNSPNDFTPGRQPHALIEMSRQTHASPVTERIELRFNTNVLDSPAHQNLTLN